METARQLDAVREELAGLRELLRRLEADRFARERDQAMEDKDRERALSRLQQTLGDVTAQLGALRHSTDVLAHTGRADTRGGLRRLRDSLRAARRSVLTRTCTFELRPMHDVKPQKDGDYNWLATGLDPALHMLPAGGRFPTGWARIHFEFHAEDGKPASARLYVDTGGGFNESGSIHLPRGRDGVVEMMIRLPDEVRGIRFDPTNRSGRFRLGPVTIAELGKYQAALDVVLPYAREVVAEPRRLRGALGKTLQVFRSDGVAGLKRKLREKALGERPGSHDYDNWIESYDTLDDTARAGIRARLAALPLRPLMSVVMPVYNPPIEYLRRAIETVRAQLYEHWELCIADDCSPNPEVGEVLRELAKEDARIKVVFREKNGHISAASNSALALASGELVVLMDHDDELPEHALYWVLEEHNAHPDAGIIFSDEDKLDEQGRRFDPYFKSDWNPDLFYSHNLISHLGVYKTELIRQVGGFRVGLEGSQDYDLALRIIEKLQDVQIRHIPRVLYHWRAILGSTARSPDQKDYAEVAARRAIQDHFERVGSAAKIEPGPSGGLHRARYPLPAKPPLVSIIIPTRDGLRLLRRTVDSILAKTTYPSFELLIVDNDSKDRQTLAYLRQLEEHGTARVIAYPGAFHYSAINNVAARQAQGELLAFLNNDLEVISPEWLGEMVSHAVRPEVGAVGAKLYFPDDTIQHAGILLGLGAHGVAGTPHRGVHRTSLGHFGKAKLLQDLSAVTAACLVLRRSTFEAVGGFDEQEFAVAFNDVDLCLRIGEQGLRILWTPHAELYHYESSSRGPEDTPEKKERFAREVEAMKRRHGERLCADPYYNPNMTLDSDDYALSWPPRLTEPWRRA